MMAKTTRLEHSADLGARDDGMRVATGLAYGIGISIALWMIGAGIVVLLLR
jgi:hypothetical protein